MPNPPSTATQIPFALACNSCGAKVEENGKVLKVYTITAKTGAIICHTCAAKNNFSKHEQTTA